MKKITTGEGIFWVRRRNHGNHSVYAIADNQSLSYDRYSSQHISNVQSNSIQSEQQAPMIKKNVSFGLIEIMTLGRTLPKTKNLVPKGLRYQKVVLHFQLPLG